MRVIYLLHKFKGSLTFNKEYEVIGSISVKSGPDLYYYLIANDKGSNVYYNKKFFTTRSDIRESKLNELGI